MNGVFINLNKFDPILGGGKESQATRSKEWGFKMLESC